ncbi:hypothetical protein B4102_3276 [Heyndrickxia sporothermodurans]|uniref:Carrier domain-containing protein n=1 Tax=Heyndrickxia sporothermodurans TaxID=46224 RepID=A0A150KWL4_9BACI|nr:phosphopantetheine-binding protein [Heyndrickxia sporothermodurans]KYD04430.1 hypothetical protein B4102_3276 [Heyndrickxia sporothermodurans]
MTIQQDSSLEDYVQKKVNEVLKSNLPIEKDLDLIKNGLDSLGIVQLILSLESEFEIEIDDEDLILENFLTIEKIVEFMTTKYEIDYIK